MPRVFVSHSTGDAALAATLVDLMLRHGLKLSDADIRFSSDASTGFGITHSWLEKLRTDITASDVVLALVTRSFLQSQTCNSEIGAAFALSRPLLPLNLADLDFEAFGPVLRSCNILRSDQISDGVKHLASLLDLPLPDKWTLEDVARQVGDALVDPYPRPILERGDILPGYKVMDAALLDDSLEASHYHGNTIEETFVASQEDLHPLPSRLVWGNPYAPIRWIELCNDPLYYHGESVRFLQDKLPIMLDTLRRLHPACLDVTPDIVSLGCGDGRKDVLVLRALNRHAAESYSPFYYPLDANVQFIHAACQRMRDVKSLRNFRVKGVLGNFYFVDSLLPVFDYREGANLFLLLGNTLGNQEADLDLLRRLFHAMTPGDALVLEVRFADLESPLVAGGADEKRRTFNFGPLESIGVPYDDSKLRYVEAGNSSQIPGTRTLLGMYGPYRPPAYEPSLRDLETVLCCIHHYDRRSLREQVEKLGFEVLDDGDDRFMADDRSFGLIVLRRKPPRNGS